MQFSRYMRLIAFATRLHRGTSCLIPIGVTSRLVFRFTDTGYSPSSIPQNYAFGVILRETRNLRSSAPFGSSPRELATFGRSAHGIRRMPCPFSRSSSVQASLPSATLSKALADSPQSFLEIKGFEPLTPCLQGRCSPN